MFSWVWFGVSFILLMMYVLCLGFYSFIFLLWCLFLLFLGEAGRPSLFEVFCVFIMYYGVLMSCCWMCAFFLMFCGFWGWCGGGYYVVSYLCRYMGFIVFICFVCGVYFGVRVVIVWFWFMCCRYYVYCFVNVIGCYFVWVIYSFYFMCFCFYAYYIYFVFGFNRLYLVICFIFFYFFCVWL